jgi:hypothetical protein
MTQSNSILMQCIDKDEVNRAESFMNRYYSELNFNFIKNIGQKIHDVIFMTSYQLIILIIIFSVFSTHVAYNNKHDVYDFIVLANLVVMTVAEIIHSTGKFNSVMYIYLTEICIYVSNHLMLLCYFKKYDIDTNKSFEYMLYHSQFSILIIFLSLIKESYIISLPSTFYKYIFQILMVTLEVKTFVKYLETVVAINSYSGIAYLLIISFINFVESILSYASNLIGIYPSKILLVGFMIPLYFLFNFNKFALKILHINILIVLNSLIIKIMLFVLAVINLSNYINLWLCKNEYFYNQSYFAVIGLIASNISIVDYILNLGIGVKKTNKLLLGIIFQTLFPIIYGSY